MNTIQIAKVAFVAASLAVLSACNTQEKIAAPVAESQPSSLYSRLGGSAALTAVVDDFLGRVALNPLVGPRFKGANMPRVRDKLILLVASATGGPEVYDGGSMKAVHKGMDITDEEFDSLVADLVGTLDHFKVPEQEKAELLGLLAPMRSDIVAQGPAEPDQFTIIEGHLKRIQRQLATFEAKAFGRSPERDVPPIALNVEKTGGPPPTKWTPAEKKIVASLIKRYETASEAVDGDKRRDLVGYPLSHTRFLSDDGTVVDLNDSLGKPHVLFIMRGFSGEFCLHCSTQLISLSRFLGEFNKRDVAVHVIYPGDANTVVPFVAGIKKLDKDFRPPFSLLLDVDLVAVKDFLIEGSLAKPTTMVLDKKGVVRWAYVGKQPSDRPSVQTVLKEVDEITAAR